MAAADVFAMPSVGEPFGLVYAEAMAMELPVVALDSGGAPEVVQHGITGLLSAPGDLDALADNLCAAPVRPRPAAPHGRERAATSRDALHLGPDGRRRRQRLSRGPRPPEPRRTSMDTPAPVAGPAEKRGNDAVSFC